jgi:hypothetical protein
VVGGGRWLDTLKRNSTLHSLLAILRKQHGEKAWQEVDLLVVG